MGASPIGVPSGNAGSIANAKSQLRAAYDIIAKTIGAFPMGSDDAKAVAQLLQSLNRLAPPSAEVPGVQQTTAAGLNADAQKNAMLQMLRQAAPAGASAGGGGAPGGPGGPPSPAMPSSLAA